MSALYDPAVAARLRVIDTAAQPHPSDWRDKTEAERREWFDANQNDVATAHAVAMAALQGLAAVMKRSGAAERRDFIAADFISDIEERVGDYMAEEVRAALGIG